jgi:hypothetical protein
LVLQSPHFLASLGEASQMYPKRCWRRARLMLLMLLRLLLQLLLLLLLLRLLLLQQKAYD